MLHKFGKNLNAEEKRALREELVAAPWSKEYTMILAARHVSPNSSEARYQFDSGLPILVPER